PPAPERRQGGVRALPPPPRAGPAAVRAVLVLRQPRGSGRLRPVLVRQRPRLSPRHRAHAAHHLPHPRRTRVRAAHCATPGHHCGAEAPLLRGHPLHHGGGGGPGLAHLLAGHHAHHRVRGAAPAAPRLRVRHLAALPHALVLPGRRAGPHHHAPRPLRPHRGHEHGLHQDRASQGLAGVARGGEARLPQRLHPGHHRAGTPVRPAPGRGDHHRDRLRLARRGHADRGFHPEPGLPGGAVRGGAAGAPHRGGEPPGGYPGRLHRPAGAGGRMSAVGAPSGVALDADRATPMPAPRPGIWWRQLRRLKWGVGAGIVLLVIVLGAVLAPLISPHDPLVVDIRHRLAPPAWMKGGTPEHLLGTDQIGRDLLSRVIYGGRVSLIVGVSSVLLSSTIGVLLGLAAGYFGRKVDWIIMTVVNVVLTFPFVLLALAVIAVLGPSLPNMIAVLGIAGWPIYARVIRAETIALKEREFVMAGRALGMSHLRLIFRQILPNLVSAGVVIATLQVALVIVLESFLSFLGLGVQPPIPAWGNMLGEGRVYMLNSWWIAAFPGAAIFITTLVINLMGNALRDWLDPHMKL